MRTMRTKRPRRTTRTDTQRLKKRRGEEKGSSTNDNSPSQSEDATNTSVASNPIGEISQKREMYVYNILKGIGYEGDSNVIVSSVFRSFDLEVYYPLYKHKGYKIRHLSLFKDIENIKKELGMFHKDAMVFLGFVNSLKNRMSLGQLAESKKSAKQIDPKKSRERAVPKKSAKKNEETKDGERKFSIILEDIL